MKTDVINTIQKWETTLNAVSYIKTPPITPTAKSEGNYTMLYTKILKCNSLHINIITTI